MYYIYWGWDILGKMVILNWETNHFLFNGDSLIYGKVVI